MVTMQEKPEVDDLHNISPLHPKAYMAAIREQQNEAGTPNKWKINSGFRKLQRRINERHKSGKSGIVTTRSLPPISDESPRKSHSVLNRKKLASGPVTNRTSVDKPAQAVPSEVNISLYRTSNNGLTRMTARRPKITKASFGSLDYTDSTSDNLPTATTPAPNPPKLPVIDKSRLLKQEVEKLDREHHEYSDEVLEQRIMKWIEHCKQWDIYDGAPYDDLDRKLRSKFKHKNTITDSLSNAYSLSNGFEEGEGIIVKQGILKNKSSNVKSPVQNVTLRVSPRTKEKHEKSNHGDPQQENHSHLENKSTKYKQSSKVAHTNKDSQNYEPTKRASPHGHKIRPDTRNKSIPKNEDNEMKTTHNKTHQVNATHRDSPLPKTSPTSTSSPLHSSPIYHSPSPSTLQQSMKLRQELSDSKHSFHLKSEKSELRLKTGDKNRHKNFVSPLTRSKTIL